MLGICKNLDRQHDSLLLACFRILDNLFHVLTFRYYFVSLFCWWLFGDKISLGKGIPLSIKKRFKWCYLDIIEIGEDLFFILTLGYLYFDCVTLKRLVESKRKRKEK